MEAPALTALLSRAGQQLHASSRPWQAAKTLLWHISLSCQTCKTHPRHVCLHACRAEVSDMHCNNIKHQCWARQEYALYSFTLYMLSVATTAADLQWRSQKDLPCKCARVAKPTWQLIRTHQSPWNRAAGPCGPPAGPPAPLRVPSRPPAGGPP